ncbi:unnamed protein product, partial [Ceratitis capitata]
VSVGAFATTTTSVALPSLFPLYPLSCDDGRYTLVYPPFGLPADQKWFSRQLN